ncbi:hypothetical protein TGAM01_v203542 [Trichoderma gamsii]|uniref:DNA2/NAM7 helicase-like C-terminal domain-containing protein n=1 Tax=Trichoderma gamsii TaxID=398673 RepID=A0A2P4ZU06_9HYPO|nr:hypothetical protein TGAM01_v203542 [Trichoderma gamsii]PON27775.1 hypothetical protein TGAM01_v203542 [Trichoderma gamsii]
MSQPTAPERTPVPKPHYWKSSALLLDDTVIFGGKGLGFETPFDITIHVHNETHKTAWFGFSLSVPLGPNLEEDGFGMCHTLSRHSGRLHVAPAETYDIQVLFPSNAYSFTEDLPPSLLAAIPDSDKLCRLNVYLKPGTYSTIKRFGMPFSHPGTEIEAVINDNEPMCAGRTLVDILQQREFSFVVAASSNAVDAHWLQDLPPPFRYPYGEEHSWSYERYDELIKWNKGPQFVPAWSFDNENEHLAALTQSEIQDVMWVHQASKEIRQEFLRAYFIAPGDADPQDCRELFAIVSLGTQFIEQYRQPWSRLVSSGHLKLRLFDHEGDQTPAEWSARIAEGFDMARHSVHNGDFVLQVQRPSSADIDHRPDFVVKAFRDRRSADSALRRDKDSWTCVSLQFDDDLFRDQIRKVKAVNWFNSEAKPFNAPEEVDGEVASPPVSEDLQLKMALHRALVHGNGFWNVLVQRLDDEEVERLADAMAKARLTDNADNGGFQAESTPRRSLPAVNLIDLPQRHIDALLADVLLDDRLRLYNYLVKSHLGLVLVAAPPGFGKTSLLSTITLSMAANLRKIFAAAPTNVATDNFAERLHVTTEIVVMRLNQGKEWRDKTRDRRTFIMRGYKPEDEYQAFINLLRDPKLGDKAAPNDWISESHWKLHLSPSFWLLMALGSEAVRKLHDDDHSSIHELQRILYSMPDCERLRKVARGDMTWEEYQSGPMADREEIESMFYTLLQAVDILCTTPSLSCQGDFKAWKEKANGIAVDEAGNISRPDLYCVWGNTLLPCAMGGDDRQFAPAKMTRENETDDDENHLNRFGGDARISALEFFRGSGWPTFRLRVQLRMARGLFDICHQHVYRDLPFSYGAGSVLGNHPVGQALEEYLLTRFPELYRSPSDTLSACFFHCPGSTCVVDDVSKSKRNPDQVEHALEFLSDLVTNSAKRIRASNIAIISPYTANVKYVELRRKAYPALSAMAPAATVDSFQGREADIIVVIMGTTQTVGPGFTTDKRRLNVMLSRQRSGLLIFGDINVLGPMKDMGKGKGKSLVRVNEDGNKQFMRKGMLYHVLRKLHDQGRVVTLPCRGW